MAKNSYADPYLFPKKYAALDGRTDLNTKEFSSLRDQLIRGDKFLGDYVMGRPFGEQGLNDDIIDSPDNWINLVTITKKTYLFYMYEGHLPSNVTVIINQESLKKLNFDDAIAFQDWD